MAGAGAGAEAGPAAGGEEEATKETTAEDLEAHVDGLRRILRDAQRAVQLMRHKTAELGLPNAKIGIVGFSAGGHLACMTATRCRTGSADSADPVEKLSSRPDFACLIYPVVSFMDHGHGGSCGNLLGKDATEENRKTYSGEFNVSKDTPPIFMVHANDDFVKVENSVVFYQALNKQNIPVEMHIVSRGGHGFFDGKGWSNSLAKKHGIRSIPAMWLIDKNGNLVDKNARNGLEGKVEKLLVE